MNQPERFYTSGGTLGRLARSYVTRRADDDLLGHLLNGDFCYVLTSRQMGKSSLMVRTADTLRSKGVNVAILDLTRIGQNVSLEQWYDGLLVRLGSDLGLEDELDEYWTSDDVSRMGPMQRFMGALREVVLPKIKGMVSIFIDEIDSIRSLPFSSDEFFAGLRECYNRRVADPEFKRLSFCLLGVAQPSDLISDVRITPFNIGHRIELTDFSEAEARPLLDGLRNMSTRPEGAEAILHRILYWTGGHPYLTQKLCETMGQLDKDVLPKDVDFVCAELFLSSRSRQQQDNLIFVRDRVLASKEYRAEILDLYEKVLRGKKVWDDDANATIDPLRLSGLVVISNGYLRVRNRIYARVFDRHWIRANMPDAELRRQKAAYRRGVTLALGISLPVLVLITSLGIADIYTERDAVRESYFAAASSAQDALNVGDYGTGNEIIDKWRHDPAPTNWLERTQQIKHWWDDWYQAREALERSFAIRLLEGEAIGESAYQLQRQGKAPPDPRKSACGAEMTVATTIYQGLPLIAAAGRDSSIQIWRSDTHVPFSSPIQLRYYPDKQTIRPGPLEPCDYDPKDGSSLPGITSLSFSPDGSKLAIATGTWSNARSLGFVLLWDMKHPDTPGSVMPQATFEKTADWVQFSSDEKDKPLYLAASSEDGTAKIWKVDPNGLPPHINSIDPRPVKSWDGLSAGLGGSGAHVVALSPPAEHWMAIGYGDGHLVIYDYLHPDSTKPLYVGIAHISGIMSMAFLDQSGAGKQLLLAVGSRDGDLVLMSPSELIEAYNHGVGEMKKDDIRKAVKATLRPGQGVLLGLTAGYGYDAGSGDYRDHRNAWLLTSGSVGTVDLWSVTPHFHLLATFVGHRDSAQSAAFCQMTQDPKMDSGCIVSASSYGDVRLWRYPFREHEQLDSHLIGHGLWFPGQMLGVAFLPDRQNQETSIVSAVGATTSDNLDQSTVVATYSFDSTAKTEPVVHESLPTATKPLLGFGVSPDGRFLVSTTRNRDLVFVDPDGTPEGRQTVNVSLNPKILVRCLDGGGAVLPNVPTDRKGGCLPDQHDYLVMGVADRADIADSAHRSGQGLCIWHITDGGSSQGQRFTIAKGNFNPCESPASDPCDSRAQSDQKLSQAECNFRELARRVGMFDISVNGQMVATSVDAGDRTCVMIWRTSDLLRGGSPDPARSTPDCLTSSDHFESFHRGFDAQFSYMSFSPDGVYIAATNIRSVMYFWPVKMTNDVPTAVQKDEVRGVTPKFRWFFENPQEAAQRLPARGQVMAFSPSGETIAIGLQDGGIVLWSTQYRHRIMEIHQQQGGILGLAFSPDGESLASSGNDGIMRVMHAEEQLPTR